jgi:SAM-dependent methyltransferase
MLLDLACGRGGYGLEIIRRTNTRVVGVDFSAVAIQQARRQAEAFGLTDCAEFRRADMIDTGLGTASVDAALCVDSIHFANPVSMALRECLRVLKPGGRVALTAWQISDNADEEVRRRSPHRDLAAELEAAGFEQVKVSKKPTWCAAERAMWLAATSIETGDDPALSAMRDEANLVLSMFGTRHRVLATAVAPTERPALRTGGTSLALVSGVELRDHPTVAADLRPPAAGVPGSEGRPTSMSECWKA